MKYRGIVIDNLLDKELKTKQCDTEESARNEAKNSIERLCKRFKVANLSGRFELSCIQTEK